MKTKSIVLLAAFVGLSVTSPLVQAETLVIEDFTFSIGNVPTGAGVLGGRWGTWDAVNSTFVQAVTSTLNLGYVDLRVPASKELYISLNQVNNSVYSSGTAMALAIFTDGSANAQSLNYNASFTRAVFTDPAWVIPTFNNNATSVPWSFSANTVARVGTISILGGTETISLIPEPSSFSLLGIGLAALLARRRKRS